MMTTSVGTDNKRKLMMECNGVLLSKASRRYQHTKQTKKSNNVRNYTSDTCFGCCGISLLAWPTVEDEVEADVVLSGSGSRADDPEARPETDGTGTFSELSVAAADDEPASFSEPCSKGATISPGLTMIKHEGCCWANTF
jgi:hypothetical protein